MESFQLLLVISVASGWFMAGLCWIVQGVLYPAFNFVEPSRFPAFHTMHANHTTLIISIPVLLELGSTTLLAWNALPGDITLQSALILFSMLLLVIIWADTGLRVIPLHNTLVKNGRQRDVIQKLVRRNLPRTLLWTLKSILLSILLVYIV